MKKGQLKALFIEAKGTGQKYIGVMIQTEGSSEPEVIINPKENFNAKFDYYMAAYDDDLILIAAKGKKDIRITGAAAGASFEDIQSQLIDEKASYGWKEQISDAVDRVVDKMLKETPPETEEERQNCETMRETIKGMFLTQRRSKTEQLSFYVDTELFVIKQYEEEINYKMLTDEEQDDGFYYKYNEKVLFRTDSKTQMEYLKNGVSGSIMKPNEARRKLDLPDGEGGDTLLANGSIVPLTMAGTCDSEHTHDDKTGEHCQRCQRHQT